MAPKKTDLDTPDVITPPAPTPSERSSGDVVALRARVKELEEFIEMTCAHGLNYSHAAEILKKGRGG